MAQFDNAEELLSDLYDYGTQDVYGVICEAEGQRAHWGFMDDSLDAAKARARELTDRYGYHFRAVTMRLTPKVIKR